MLHTVPPIGISTSTTAEQQTIRADVQPSRNRHNRTSCCPDTLSINRRHCLPFCRFASSHTSSIFYQPDG